MRGCGLRWREISCWQIVPGDDVVPTGLRIEMYARARADRETVV